MRFPFVHILAIDPGMKNSSAGIWTSHNLNEPALSAAHWSGSISGSYSK